MNQIPFHRYLNGFENYFESSKCQWLVFTFSLLTEEMETNKSTFTIYICSWASKKACAIILSIKLHH